MRNLLSIALMLVPGLATAVLAADAAGQAPAPYTIIVVLPTAPSPETETAAKEFLNSLVGEAPAGTRLICFDGPARQRLAEAEIPDNLPPAGRIRALSRPLAPVFKHLQKRRAVREGAVADALDVPGFVPTVASLIKTTRGKTRLILIGSEYHHDPEKAATFARGQVPSLDHVLASSKISPFGTSDLNKALDGLRIDWLLIDQSSTRERAHVCSFWSAYFSTNLNASLSSFLESPKDVAERAAANADDKANAATLKPTGELQILTIDALKGTSVPGPQSGRQSLVKPFDVPADLTRLIGAPVAVVLLVDGTSSNGEALKSAAGLSVDIGRLGADLSPRFELAVLIHRGTDRISTWAGPIERPGADGTVSKGMAALNHFIDEPNVDVERIADATGERPGRKTGEKTRVKPFEPVTAYINIENALNTALKTLGELRADRKVLLVVGDAGPSEFDGTEGVSDQDRESEARALQAVRDFLRATPDARIVTVFTGPHEGDTAFTADHADAARFFKKLAAMAGDRGKFTTSLADMPDLTKRAILNR